MHDPSNDLFDANAANSGSAKSNMKQRDSIVSLREGTRNRVALRESPDRQVKDFMHYHVVVQRYRR